MKVEIEKAASKEEEMLEQMGGYIERFALSQEMKAKKAAEKKARQERMAQLKQIKDSLTKDSIQRGALMAFQVQEGRNFGCRIQSTAEGRNPKMHRMAGGDWTGCCYDNCRFP